MRRVERTLLVLALSAVASCEREGEPRPQWVVHVGTDAPLPGLGDRVRVDVLGPDRATCEECTRVFDVGGGGAVPLSFGVVPAEEGATWLRVRLYRADGTGALGEPTEPLLEVLGVLPALDAAPVDVAVSLTMACFGVAADVDAGSSCDPASAEVVTSLELPRAGPDVLPEPGSWGGGEEPCVADAPPGMVCVRGGAFLLGSRSYVPFGADYDPVPEQLVRLSPFFLDVDEMTVATYRQLVALGAAEPASGQEFCTYSPTPGDDDAESVNCLTHAEASAACALLGKRLPTEAEWEYAAGGRSAESRVPWSHSDGSNAALCRAAILARGVLLEESHSRLCITLEPQLPVGPVAGGAFDDVTDLGLRNLGGNLAEWVADDFAPYSDATCWGASLDPRDDPRCVTGGADAVYRGGSWTSLPYNSHPFFRWSAAKVGRLPSLGVRCASSAR